jgi:hypothetical protein
MGSRRLSYGFNEMIDSKHLQTTLTNLYTLLYFSLMMSLPLFTNYILLNFKGNTFVATTLVEAEIVKFYGHVYSDLLDVKVFLPNLHWQDHTLSYIKNGLVIPGIATYIISAITSLDIVMSVYLPIPYIISLILLYLIIKRICSDAHISDASTFIILLLSTTIFIANYVLGCLYTMDYHSYSIPLFLIMLYIFTNLWFDYVRNRYDMVRSIVIVLLTSIALAGTHYRLIYEALGGLITVIIIITLYAMIKSVKNISLFVTRVRTYLSFVLVILTTVFLQGFYASFIGTVDINKVIKNIIIYLTTFYKISVHTMKEEVVHYIVINPLYLLALKIFTYASLTYILLLTFGTIFSRYSNREIFNTVKIFWFILGGSFIIWIPYLIAYGYGNFGLEQSWLVIASILASSLTITRKIIHASLVIRQSLIKITVLTLTMLVISSTLVSLYFEVEQSSSYNALTPPPAGVEWVGEFIARNSRGRLIICAAHSTASRIYIHIATSHLKLLRDIIIANIPYTIDVFKLCQMLQSKYDIIIISITDLTKGTFGDVAPSYLNATITTKLAHCLTNNVNVMLNSNNYMLFFSS